MPILKRRKGRNWMRVYRPAGARYAEARSVSATTGVKEALKAFAREFGRPPVQEKTNIEIMGVTADWCVTVWEIDDD
jgi:hypothetical protein